MRLTAVAAIALVVLAVFVLARTAAFRSRQIAAAPATRVAIDARAIERLSHALRLKTVSAPADFSPEIFRELHTFLAETFPRAHETLEREVFSECSLLYRWPGTDASAPPILLMSHLDVVPVSRVEAIRWTHDPWSGTIADGYVWGRGALDVKSGVMSMLEAVEFLLGEAFEPRCDVYLAFGHDEEVGGHDGNAQMALALRERGVRLAMVLDEGGAIIRGALSGLSQPVAMVAVAEKGHATVRLSVDMPPGHASMPPPQTAIGVLCQAIERLEASPPPASLGGTVGVMLDYIGPEMGFAERAALANRDLMAPILVRRFTQTPSLNALVRTTTSANVISGGSTYNTLPAHAEALVNFRLLPGDMPQSVLAYARRTIADPRVLCELNGGSSPPSSVSNHESAQFHALAGTIRQIDPDVVVAPGLAVVATDARHYEPLAEEVFRFLPLRLSADDLPRIHGIDERISTDNYLEMIQFMIQLLKNATG